MSLEIATVSYDSLRASQEFSQALRETGFVILQDIPINPSLIEEVFDAWKKFFQSDEKYNYPFSIENTDGFVSTAVSESAKGSQQKDLKEFYHLLRNGRCPAELRDKSFSMFDQLLPIAETLLRWVELHLPEDIRQQLSEPLVHMMHESPNNKLRIIHYPPLHEKNYPVGAVRAAAHADINLLTLLPAATAKGLQAMLKGSKWVDVPCQLDSLIVNAGDMLKEATRGYIKSTVHRVINPEGIDARLSRMSMPLFVHPRNDVVLSDRYTALEYRMQRYAENGFISNVKHD